ncbi:MAG: hypothetical protein KatS3mg024_1586 [Armatimonadota bacterium]|nr:MAG: hypothetical protein KatS3mg024_1586 [Armatimonadota bacterium]
MTVKEMNCGRTSRLISAYLDGELPGSEMLAIREHLRSCPRCSAEMEDIRQVKAAMARLTPVRPAADLEARLLAAVAQVETPASARFSAWLLERLGGHLQPAAAAVGVCAVLLAISVGHLPQANHWQDPVAERITQTAQTVTLPEMAQDRAIEKLISASANPAELPGAGPAIEPVLASPASMTSAILVPVSDSAFGAR